MRWLGLTLAAWLLLVGCGVPAVLALSDAQQLVVEAWRLVNQSYVDPAHLDRVQWRRLRQKALEKPIRTSKDAYDAIEAMLMPIGDSYTRILRPADFGALRATTEGSVCGVGLQLALREGDGGIVVIAPLDGSPAAEAGIASGSEVVLVNGSPARELGLEKTAASLRGAADTDVVVTLRSPQRPGGSEREVVLRRRKVKLLPVRSRTISAADRRLGYLRITQFSEPVPKQWRRAMEAWARPPHIDGLILDLRNNSGGLVSAGVAVANDLLDGAPIVETEDRGGMNARQQAAPGRLYSGPMVTLVNGGTASASEILAGALQDNGRSALVGDRTFGKGLIQTLISLGDGSGLTVTVARYLTPDGHDIQEQGIGPDVELTPPEPLNPGGPEDSWLEQAQQLLLEQIATAAAASPAAAAPASWSSVESVASSSAAAMDIAGP